MFRLKFALQISTSICSEKTNLRNEEIPINEIFNTVLIFSHFNPIFFRIQTPVNLIINLNLNSKFNVEDFRNNSSSKLFMSDRSR
jgi:hypothetical protein